MRSNRYADYEKMDTYPMISTVLGGYAEDVVPATPPPSAVDRLAALADPGGRLAQRIRDWDNVAVWLQDTRPVR